MNARPLDLHGRPLRNLRVSVTDRCNLRCSYCMPEDEYVWLRRTDLLSFEEIARLVDVFSGLGVDRVRLTGGEPLLRTDLPALVKMLAVRRQLRDLALTTNGTLLGEMAAPLQEAGLRRVTVSLDTLRADRFEELTRRDGHRGVLEGLRAAATAGFRSLKINMVVVRGFNDDELPDMLRLGRELRAEVRFIEYMDVGGATRWSAAKVVPRQQILERLGRPRALPEAGSAPARRYVLEDGTTFGIIASTTMPFCGSCDRSRLTADGMWYRCLYAREGTDLRSPLRAGEPNEALARLVAHAWSRRDDRGAEERLAVAGRGALLDRGALRADPHREMHTRGG